MKVTIYSDGGSDPNPGIGGWAAILMAGKHEKVLKGNDPNTTNNRMELTAAIRALEALKRPSEVDFYVDSEYVRRGITEWITKWQAQNWKRKGGQAVPNADLWQQLWPLTKQHQIEWHWVKGHAGNEYNERVDKLARAARLEITPKAEVSADSPRLYLRSSCIGNPGPGGWGVIYEFEGEDRQLSGGEPKTTNNRMELMAAIEALSMVEEGAAVQLFTTSDYLFQGATKWIHGWRGRGWKKRDGQPIANGELWQKLDALNGSYRIAWINAKGQDLEAMKIAGMVASDAAKLSAESAS